MIIQFDPNKMHVQAVCGILEEYKPDQEIADIYRKVEELKTEMSAFRDTVLNPKLNEIMKLVDAHNKKHTPVPTKSE